MPEMNRPVWVDQLSSDEAAALHRQDWLAAPDILVIGGGMIGVATARACLDAGLGSALLIEREQLGAGATRGAAGLIAPEPHHGVDPPWFVDWGRASLRLWRELHAATPGGVGLLDLTWLGLPPHPYASGDDRPPGAELVDAQTVAALVPGLATPSHGVLIRHQARLNPLRGLLSIARGLPHVATDVQALSVSIDAERITSVHTTRGDISPGAVVFAMGSPPRLTGLELDVPFDLVKGHLLATEPVHNRLPGTVAPFVTQLDDGRVLSGGSVDPTDAAPEPDARVLRDIHAEMVGALPALNDVGVGHQWCCFRPHHPDNLPIVDRVPGTRNAWFSSGQYKTGILMAPVTARALATWIRSSQQPQDVQSLRLSRFAVRSPVA
jgi:glycine oxidase